LKAVLLSPTFGKRERPPAAKCKRLETLRQLLHTWQHLQQRLHDTRELIELGEESLRPELTAEVQAIQAEVRQLDLQMMLSGPHDASNAIFAIHTGAGGVDAQDFAEMIMRMYLRWCDANAFTAEIVDQSPGDSAGIKSVVMTINGHNAYGYLKAEAGVHRLVRLSPFDANHRRHTSFVLVEVLPEIAEAGEVDLNPNDLRIDVYRAASAGGQNVQKNATAIRITHLPTGIVVTCQNERSQAQTATVPCVFCEHDYTKSSCANVNKKLPTSKATTPKPSGVAKFVPTCCILTKWSKTIAPNTRPVIPKRC
jgi:peptide chain release factor 2